MKTKSNNGNSGQVIVFCIILFFFFYIILYASNSSGNTVSIADGYTISAYDVKLDVQEDLKVNVTEKITINWYNTNHHGIYKFTPEWYEYTSKDNKTIKRKSIISDYRSLDDPYTIDVVKKKKRIKIGSANSFVSYGDKLYTIAYTYDMGKDPFNGFDEFIFHAYGDYWGTDINNASMEIVLPKSFKKENIKFFADKYRKDDITSSMEISVIENTIKAKSKEPLKSALTFDIVLPDNYFVGGSFNYGVKSLISILVGIILTIITIITWYKYGKNHPKRVPTVEFYPPDNLSSAEIGYIYGNNNMKKLTISLVLSLASKGYIKIDTEGKKKIRITNCITEPKKPYIVKDAPKRKIEVQKLFKGDKYPDLSGDELTMMKYLFRTSDIHVIEANIDKFLKVKNALVSKGYLKIISDNNDEIEDIVNNAKKNEKYEYEKYQKELAEYNAKLENLPALNEYERCIFDNLISQGSSFYLSEHLTFYKLFGEIQSALESDIKEKIKDSKASSKIFGAIIRVILTAVCYIFAYSIFEDLDPRLFILYKVCLYCIPISIFFIIFMGRKTTYGEEIKAKVLGFRNFLIKVEKEQLERLVSQNPSYFYNILPYTYVLGISKKWVSKFEDIYYPQVDMGSFDYSNDSSYLSFCNNVYYPTPSYSSSSSGCSSCGGGCSSCGGGCSSCGGGGSW